MTHSDLSLNIFHKDHHFGQLAVDDRGMKKIPSAQSGHPRAWKSDGQFPILRHGLFTLVII